MCFVPLVDRVTGGADRLWRAEKGSSVPGHTSCSPVYIPLGVDGTGLTTALGLGVWGPQQPTAAVGEPAEMLPHAQYHSSHSQ